MKFNQILNEDDENVIFPQSPYARIKLMEEKIIAKKIKNTNYVIIRLGTIIGNQLNEISYCC